MAGRVAWGRKAVLTANGTTITGTKDITTDDQADVQTAECRDEEYKTHNKGAKEFTLEFDVLLKQTNDASIQILEDSYDEEDDEDAEITFVLRRGPGEKGITFVGQVFKWPEEFPEGDAGKIHVVCKPTDPDNPPTRVAAV